MATDEANPILIVEDSPTQAEQLKLWLEQHGFEVIHAVNGAVALEWLRQHRPLLVLSDIVMPRMDGFQLCRAIRDDADLRDLPVVLLTTLADPEDVVRGLECGADNFITKPYVEQDLLSRIQFILAHRHLRQHERTDIGVEVFFAGRKHSINANRLQILNLLLSTYETAVQKHHELERMRDELRQLNEELEQRVVERTAELERKNQQLADTSQQLLQAAKLATMGELAASIAHELNNPLATVSIRTEMLLDAIPQNDPQRTALDVIAHETERMAALVSNLLQFARSGPQRASTLNVCEELDATLGLISYRFKPLEIELIREYATEIPLIHADRQKLRQVFINLITNAIDAMQNPGRARRLTVRVAGHEPGPEPPTAVAIDVIDTGAGIPPELHARVLEPFFTTKIEGQGTGLGLAICKRIIDEHKGQLIIESAEGQGTMMRVVLPQNVMTNAHAVTA